MENKYIKNLSFLFFIVGSGCISIIIIYWVINNALIRSMEQQAITVAEIVAKQSTSARSVYARFVAGKLLEDGTGPNVHYSEMKGYIPIPAQFLKLMGREASKTTSDLFFYRPISKWNLEPTQGLTNEFLVWAWSQLEAQDQQNPAQAIDWKPVWRVETDKNGQRMLRYLKADPASSESCASCHNNYELTPTIQNRREQSGIEVGKQWKQHQLLGALYVNIPLKKVEAIVADQNRQTVIMVAIILLFAMIITGFVIRRLFIQGQSLSKLSYQASHDSLTGLVNRRGFERYMDRLYDEDVLSIERVEHVLLLMDLDGFKSVNDNFGHQAGDDLLICISKTLNELVRSNDIVARLGGDEFAVILNDCPYEQAKRIAMKMLVAVREAYIEVDDQKVSVGISIGMGMLEGDTGKFDEIIDTIDSACYEAKKNGKNQVYYIEDQELHRYEL